MGPVFPPSLSCQLNVPEPVTPTSTLWQRIRNRGDVEAFAEQLADPTQTMLSVFPQSQLPLENHVYILVELPSGEPIVVMFFDHRHY